MITTTQLLQAVKDAHGIPSNYKLAPFLGVTEHTVGSWNVGRNLPDDKTAVRLAELAGLDPAYVLACIAAQRAKDEGVKTAWANLARRLEGLAASVLAVLVLGVGLVVSPDASAIGKTPSPGATVCSLVYYVNRLARTGIARCMGCFSRILRPAALPILAA